MSAPSSSPAAVNDITLALTKLTTATYAAAFSNDPRLLRYVTETVEHTAEQIVSATDYAAEMRAVRERAP